MEAMGRHRTRLVELSSHACGLGDAAVIADLAWLADTDLFVHAEELHNKDA
jgi:hypothetical protein